MPTTYKGCTIPLPSELADGPTDFQQFVDSLPNATAVQATGVPIGALLWTAAAAAPTGWLFLNGQTITSANTVYPALWAVIPATWKSGNDMILPDARGCFPVVSKAGDTLIDTIGEKGGTRTITTAMLPAHAHAVALTTSSDAHTHTVPNVVQSGSGGLVNPPLGSQMPASTVTTSSDAHTHSVNGNTGNGPGTGAAFMPNYIALNLMMRAI